jgi:ribonuclease T2
MPGERMSRAKRGRADTQASPGSFDYYLLNLSWSPEFCTTHSDSPECGHGLGFIVHGLWPQYTTGDYPENCSNAPGPANPQAYTDIIPTASLVEHEWQTHGTCSGLAADVYFATIRRAFANVKIPSDIGAANGPSSATPDQLIADFAHANPSYPAGSIALSCGNNRLTAIEICLSKDLQPEACEGVRSCRANVVQITSK